MTYTASLKGLPEATDAQRATMESRFRAMLEQLLGGPEGVVTAWRACQAQRELDKASTFTLANMVLGGPVSRWELMETAATMDAFKEWASPPGDAHFEVKA